MNDHGGLAQDLDLLLRDRRRALKMLGYAGLAPLLGCGTARTTGDAGTTVDAGNAGGCAVIPEETAGPFPGDGSNGANALTLSGIVRSDIRASLAPASGVAEGVPLTIRLTLVNTRASCAALAGYAIYVWHCDREGEYSMYTLTTQNYLRGVMATDASGTVSFTSIFPACYPGRWPHIHFEIYPSLASTTASGNKVKTSQLALPADVCNAVYATTGYGSSVGSLARVSLTSDSVFDDGGAAQMAAVTGSVAAGYTAALTVGIAV